MVAGIYELEAGTRVILYERATNRSQGGLLGLLHRSAVNLYF